MSKEKEAEISPLDLVEEETNYFGKPKPEQKIQDVETSTSSASYEYDDHLDADILELPLIVREVVPLEDDPDIPVLTFRYFLLAIIFVSPGAFISTLNSYRTTSAAYSIFFVQICSHWLGKWLAKILPTKQYKLFGKSFTLNPGPYSIKETVLVTITASSGATGSLATNAFSLGELYFDQKVNPAVAIFFMWAIVYVGYAYAALARNFLIYDPQFIWPKALMQTTLFQSFKRSDEDSKLGKKQIRVFFIALLGMTVWQFFPEYVFPFTSSLAFLCWVAPGNATANFIGSGVGGMGFLNLSLDWSNITSSIMLSPYWVLVVQFIGFVFGAWVLLPAAKWSDLTSYKFGLMSNSLFLANGSLYPTLELTTSDGHLNLTAYEYYGPVHLGAQRAWNMFFDYAAYISGITWVVLFGYDGIKVSYKKLGQHYKLQKERKKNGQKMNSINEQYTDRINKLQSAYEEVPLYWYMLMFLISFIILITVTATNSIPLPWWTVIVGLGIGLVIVIPLSWLYAISNFQLAIGTFNELLFGYMIQSQSSRHGMSANLYGCIAGDVWYRAQYFLQDLKISHYNQIKPKYTFFSQIFGLLISCPINYGCMRWVLNTKSDYLTGAEVDPLGQWTGQTISSYHSDAIQYVILGPKRLFQHYPVLPYGFLVGFAAPILIFAAHRFFPKSFLKFRLWNTTIFFSTMATFYGNLSTGYTSQIIGGTVTMFWAYRYRHTLWKNYNYLVAAAFDTGLNLSILLIFIIFTSGKVINMPNWWGNNAVSVERCFALDS